MYVPSTLQTFKDAVDDRTDEPTISSGEFHLDQNIPNPFSDQTTFTFALTKPCKAIWEITDANGRLAVRLERDYPAGELQETFSMNNVSGVYLCRLITPEGIKTRKMVVQQK